VPWPYPDDGAETFIRLQLEKIAAGEEIYQWALVLRSGNGQAIGNISFRPRAADNPKGNRGFWLAEPYWKQGLMTEAITSVNDFAFDTLGLESFHVCNVATNEASRRVKQKTGAEFVGFIELSHHNGQSRSEKWKVSRENWLRQRQKETGHHILSSNVSPMINRASGLPIARRYGVESQLVFIPVMRFENVSVMM